MSTDNEDNVGTVAAFVSGAIIGVAATMLFMRMQKQRGIGSKIDDEDYHFDGGDIFI